MLEDTLSAGVTVFPQGGFFSARLVTDGIVGRSQGDWFTDRW